MTVFLIKGATCGEERQCKEAGRMNTKPRNTETTKSLGEGHGTDYPSQPPEGTNPTNPLISDCQPPELGDNKSLLFKSSSSWDLVTALRKTDRGS